MIFPDISRVDGVRFPTNLIPLDDPIIKTWEYGMIAYLMETSNPKYPSFSSLTKLCLNWSIGVSHLLMVQQELIQ